MTFVKVMTILAMVLTLFFSYDEYKKGKMGARNFKIICVCDSVALIGLIYLSLVGVG